MKNLFGEANKCFKFLVEFHRSLPVRRVFTYSTYIQLKSNALLLNSSKSLSTNYISNFRCGYPNYYALRGYKTSDELSDKKEDKISKEDEGKRFKKPVTDDDASRLIQTLTEDFEKNLKNDITDNEQMTSDKDTIAPSFKEQFKVFRDEDASEILDIHEIKSTEMNDNFQVSIDDDIEYTIYQQKTVDQFDGLNLTRGETGVFDIEELVDLLYRENAKDICVIRVPDELHYCDYLVLISALSPRHLNSLTGFVRKLYKKKRHDTDEIINIEGKASHNWQVLDMKNIVLHVFLPEIRRVYDLESLWSIGVQYDDLTKRPPPDEVYDELFSHTQYFENMKPITETLEVK